MTHVEGKGERTGMLEKSNSTHLSAATLGRALACGAADPVDVCEDYLNRIAKHPDQNVFLTVTAERARREAESSRARYGAGLQFGPLDGVPISWKDLIHVRGASTTAGSALFRNGSLETEDAPIVANAAAAGMICLGKVNLTEFAYSGLGLNPHFGTPLNPNDPLTPHAPGGSSSGSGVSVAAGLCPVSVGTDTGGSVRIPAAFNGVVGLKTSEGRIDKSGVVALSDTLDTVGPLTRTVEDALLVDMVLRGTTTTSIHRAPLSDLMLVVPENVVFDDAEAAVVVNFEACLARLASAGARVIRRSLPLLDEVLRVTRDHGTLTAAEAYLTHRDIMEGPDVGRMDPRVAARIAMGRDMSAYDVLTIAQARRRLISDLENELQGGLLVMPTTPITAPEIAPLERDQELFHAVNLKTLRNTMIGNFLATCGLALPSGRNADGLPTSILFSAPSGEDERLISAGLAIESVLSDFTITLST